MYTRLPKVGLGGLTNADLRIRPVTGLTTLMALSAEKTTARVGKLGFQVNSALQTGPLHYYQVDLESLKTND
jgi:hypothetical protein